MVMEQKETKLCPYCGEEILAVAKKCKHCGKWLSEPNVTATPNATQIPTQTNASSSKITSIKKTITYIVVAIVVLVAGVCLFKGIGGQSKTYIKSLKTKTEIREDYMGRQEYEFYITSSGKEFDGEAWESNDLECIYMQGGVPVEIHFYYPNGQLGVATAAWTMEGAASHGTCYDSDGKEISFSQFKSEYIGKYWEKLNYKEYLTGF